MGGPLGVRVNPRRLSGTIERFSHRAHKKKGYSCLVKEMIPGNNVENIGPFRDIWSMEPFVNTVASDQRGPCDAHYKRTVAGYRTIIIRTIV